MIRIFAVYKYDKHGNRWPICNANTKSAIDEILVLKGYYPDQVEWNRKPRYNRQIHREVIEGTLHTNDDEE